MLFAIVVVLVVAPHGSRDPATATMTRALQDAIEPGSSVVVRERVGPGDDDLEVSAAAATADAVASVTGDDVRVVVRVYDARSRTTNERELTFAPSEQQVERGRATGFVIASMVTATPKAPAPSAIETPAVAERAQAVRPPPPRPDTVFGADATAIATTAFSGDGGGLGGEIGLSAVRDRVGLRVGGGLTVGSAAGEILETRTLRLKAGAKYELVRLDSERPFTVGARADIVAVQHSAMMRGGASGSRWVPAISGLGEIVWYVFPPRVGLVLDAGVEVAFGTTRVFVGDDQRSSIPLLRLVGGLGARLDF